MTKPIVATKGVVIWEKCPRDEVPNILPSTKGLKGKGAMPLLEAKKAKSIETSNVAMSMGSHTVSGSRGGHLDQAW